MGEIEQMLAESLEKITGEVQEMGGALLSLSERLGALESSPSSSEPSPVSASLWRLWLASELQSLAAERWPSDQEQATAAARMLTPSCASCPRGTPMQLGPEPRNLAVYCQMIGRPIDTMPSRCGGHPKGLDSKLRGYFLQSFTTGKPIDTMAAELVAGGHLSAPRKS